MSHMMIIHGDPPTTLNSARIPPSHMDAMYRAHASATMRFSPREQNSKHPPTWPGWRRWQWRSGSAPLVAGPAWAPTEGWARQRSRDRTDRPPGTSQQYHDAPWAPHRAPAAGETRPSSSCAPAAPALKRILIPHEHVLRPATVLENNACRKGLAWRTCARDIGPGTPDQARSLVHGLGDRPNADTGTGARSNRMWAAPVRALITSENRRLYH